jgi:glycosyltransferase involved in cell wall biosynthesis
MKKIQKFDKNILIVIDSLRLGGMERQVLLLIKGLRVNGHFRPALAVLDRGGELEKDALKNAELILSLRRRARFDITPALLLIFQARAARIGLIHAFGWMSGLAGLLAAKVLNVPIVNGCIRGAPPHLLLRDRFKLWSAHRSDIIVANSFEALKAYGLKRDPRCKIISNGVDFNYFEGVEAEPIGHNSICMVANFSFRKDQISLIKAMEKINKRIPEAKLVLIGKDRGKLDENRRLVHKLRLHDCVTFITNSSWPAPFISGSDVCVLATNVTTHGESVSNAILEYMALGKPVVATDCGGNAHVLRNGKTGFLVPGSSPAAIAERVIELLQNPHKACMMGLKGRQRIHETFSMNRMVKEYEKLYDLLLSKRHGSILPKPNHRR